MFEPDDYRTCHNCGKETYIDFRKLCQQCYTSSNKNIDNFIKYTQLSGLKFYLKIKPELQPCPHLEWVPYHNFLDIKYIAEGGFLRQLLKLTYQLKSKFVIKCYGAT
ncbi:hypothetical protein Glove_368g7 [Diversispora epigaea]|uniref:Uncharacterized protein n=1 Tax=Diversispora epigaea TaxID=1348612 RepID=A0A397HA05_9GLOM|nr:hypothetical protein Glove_368g7 [Diversispora epigaea]